MAEKKKSLNKDQILLDFSTQLGRQSATMEHLTDTIKTVAENQDAQRRETKKDLERMEARLNDKIDRLDSKITDLSDGVARNTQHIEECPINHQRTHQPPLITPPPTPQNQTQQNQTATALGSLIGAILSKRGAAVGAAGAIATLIALLFN